MIKEEDILSYWNPDWKDGMVEIQCWTNSEFKSKELKKYILDALELWKLYDEKGSVNKDDYENIKYKEIKEKSKKYDELERITGETQSVLDLESKVKELEQKLQKVREFQKHMTFSYLDSNKLKEILGEEDG